MIIALYVVFAISLLATIYTYVIYPLILKLIPIKKHSFDITFTPIVSIILKCNGDKESTDSKIKNLAEQSYLLDKIEIITTLMSSESESSQLNEILNTAKGEIIIISDTNTVYSKNAIQNLVKHFSDKSVGCVSGSLLKVDANGNEVDNGVFWKYENFVKKQESNLGSLSGTNHAIYAFRAGIIKDIPQHIIDSDFYIATYILQSGYNVIMDSGAIAYESQNGDPNSQFDRHVRDGMGYYQALRIFWRLLLPRKGSFIYVSHRVIKWFVPFNLIILFVTNIILSYLSLLMTMIFLCQISTYSVVIFCYITKINDKISASNPIKKILSILLYFLSLNLAYIFGLSRLISFNTKIPKKRGRDD